MSETNHERWAEELSAYLLGSLEPAEAEALERHLEGCERCRAELRWLAPALDALPETVERLDAPPRLRARLMAEVRADAAGSEAAPAPGHRSLLSRLRGLAGPHWRPLAAGLAVLLIAAVVVGYEVGQGGGSGGGNEITVPSSPQASGVLAAVSMEADGSHGKIKLTNVHSLPRDKVLEAWLEREGEVEAVPTLFVPNGEGEASTTLGDMRGVTAVMVTQEPPGGSEGPTSKPIVEVPLPPS